MWELHYHGIYILVKSNTTGNDFGWIYQSLQEDFKDLPRSESYMQNPKYRVKILLGPVSEPAWKIPAFRTKFVQRYFSWGRIFYQGPSNLKASLDCAKREKIFSVNCDDLSYLYEILYMFLLSAIGEFMDLQGFHRMHCVGFSTQSGCYLIPLPSGKGKSSFADWLLHETNVNFLGDETVFIGKDQVVAFPIRRAVKLNHCTEVPRVFERKYFENKQLLAWPPGRLVASESSYRVLLFANTYSDLKFSWSFFWGLGNAQMVEYFFRFPFLTDLSWIAISRLRRALSLRHKVIKIPIWQSKPQDNWACLQRNIS